MLATACTFAAITSVDNVLTAHSGVDVAVEFGEQIDGLTASKRITATRDKLNIAAMSCAFGVRSSLSLMA
jgi:hypothetical protein